jgi:putative membrane protein
MSRHIGLATAIMGASPAVAQGQNTPPWMYDGRMWWMPFHGLLSLILTAAIIAGLVFLVRHLWTAGQRGRSDSGQSAALDLLDTRYARGEIEREDYLRRRQDLLEPQP